LGGKRVLQCYFEAYFLWSTVNLNIYLLSLICYFWTFGWSTFQSSNFESNAISRNYSGDIFADAYDITSKLSLTAGLRGTWENANAGYQVQDACTASNVGCLTNVYQ
jgi:hypothetical protein